MSFPQTWLCGWDTTAWKPSSASILLWKFENLEQILAILKSVRSFGNDINEAKILSILFYSRSVLIKCKVCTFCYGCIWKSYLCTYWKKVYSFSVNMPEALLMGYELKE